jgi:hypothetical protein
MSLSTEDRISVNVDRVVFARRLGAHILREHEPTELRFGFGALPAMDCMVTVGRNVGDYQLGPRSSFDGMRVKTQGITVVAYSDSTNRLSMTIDRRSPRIGSPLQWAFAARDSLSILSSQDVQLRGVQTTRGASWYECSQAVRPVARLGLLSFFGSRSKVRGDFFIELTEFLANGGLHAEICRHIFAQQLEASKQQSAQAAELLCSTILEAVLRTIAGRPMNPKKREKFDVKCELGRFRDSFLSSKWQKACDDVLTSWRYLRHRNAHPDWLTTHGGGMATTTMAEALDHTIRLSRFYGFMILALAGWKDLEPVFPAPHAQWGPMMTITRTQPPAEGLASELQ